LSRELRTQEDLDKAREDYYKWDEYNKELLVRIVDSDRLAKGYTPLRLASLGSYSPNEMVEDLRETISDRVTRLESIGQKLELIPEAASAAAAAGSPAPEAAPPSNRVFVVHGHDEEAKQAVARYLDRLDLEPLVLHEQPNKGRTVIEKFEDYSDVGFAIVLLTPDDVAAPATTPGELKPRARQNVVLELGFFLGRLGRNKVCALHKHDIEIPSDLSGVLYVQMDDAGAWQLHLGREIKAAGLHMDLNLLI
jgi:predicted nucleotide-binding protein